MGTPPRYLNDVTHDGLHSPAVLMLGGIHWYLLRAQTLLERDAITTVQAEGAPEGFTRSERTEFGNEVGGDEINWWLTRKEPDIAELKSRTEGALVAAQKLKEAATELKKRQPSTVYEKLVETMRNFADHHAADIQTIYEYVLWLNAKDRLAPSILFTYRVWGSTKRGDRWAHVDEQDVLAPDMELALAEYVLGLKHRDLATYDYVHYRLGADIAEGMSGEDPNALVEVPIDQAVQRTWLDVCDYNAEYFTELRQSLRNIVLDIETLVTHRALLHDHAFWRDFIPKAARFTGAEPELWDFKETLDMWRARGPGRAAAKLDFAKDIAAFANARGGVLIIGVTDETRQIVGVGPRSDLENWLTDTSRVIGEYIVYPRPLVTIEQVEVPTATVPKLCVVIIIAQSSEAVCVRDDEGRFMYPLREGSGKKLVSLHDAGSPKLHVKFDNHESLDVLAQFVRRN